MKRYVMQFIIGVLLFNVTWAEKGRIDTSNKDKFIQVSSIDPRYFQYDDGSSYIPIGQNICWSRTTVDPEVALQQYDFYFKNFAENGGNLVRIWLSAPLFEVEHEKAMQYDQAKCDKLIKGVLKLAEQNGIKIKFCIENFRVLLNRPAPFEGSVPFDKPIYHTKNGGPVNNTTEYLQKEKGQNLYRTKLQFFSRNFASDPTIFGWELWNEFNAFQTGSNTTRIEWTKTMLTEAKKLFPKQLVMQTLGSYDRADERENYRTFSSLPGNEVAQVHRYMDPAPKKLPAVSAPMDILTADATRELLAFNLKKPVLVSETGAVEANHAGPSKLYPIDKEGVMLHDIIFAPFFSGAAGSGQCWHWHHYIEKNNLWWHFGRFAEVIEGVNPIKENFRAVYSESSHTRNYTLQGRKTTMAWLRDKNSSWQSELKEGTAAKVIEGHSVKLEEIGFSNDHKSIKCYQPWADSWKTAKVVDGSISLPPFKRSIVIMSQ